MFVFIYLVTSLCNLCVQEDKVTVRDEKWKSLDLNSYSNLNVPNEVKAMVDVKHNFRSYCS